MIDYLADARECFLNLIQEDTAAQGVCSLASS